VSGSDLALKQLRRQSGPLGVEITENVCFNVEQRMIDGELMTRRPTSLMMVKIGHGRVCLRGILGEAALQHQLDAVYCYRRSIAWFVGRSIFNDRETCKTAEPIEMPFGIWTQVGPRNHAYYMRSRSPNVTWQF